jgi:hypothetical protein
MSHATTTSQPVVVDVTVTLGAIVRPEPDAGRLFRFHYRVTRLPRPRRNIRRAAR